jgi:hypothetical protein
MEVADTLVFLLSHFEYTVYTTIYYTSTQQYNHNTSLYKSIEAAPPQHAANTSGGEFRSKSLQVFTASLGATQNHNQPMPPSSQSSLSTSSQIS